MKFLLTMNQIAYFKPETTARRLRNYYYHGEGNPVIFLGYLRLIRHLPQLAERAKPLQPELYRKEVRAIFLETHWESPATCWLQLFLREFREFFTPEEWRILQLRYQALHPFLGWQLVGYLKRAQQLQVVSQLVPSPIRKQSNNYASSSHGQRIQPTINNPRLQKTRAICRTFTDKT